MKSIINLKKCKKGFTMVELIVVLAILAVLAAAVAPSLLGYLNDSKEEADKMTAAQIENAIKYEIAKNTIKIDSSTGTITSTANEIKSAVAEKLGGTFPTPQSKKHFILDLSTYKVDVKDSAGNGEMLLN